MMGRRKPDRRKKANRWLTPEEQLARNVATPSRGKKKRKSKVHSHAKPLDPASGPDRKPRTKRASPAASARASAVCSPQFGTP